MQIIRVVLTQSNERMVQVDTSPISLHMGSGEFTNNNICDIERKYNLAVSLSQHHDFQYLLVRQVWMFVTTIRAIGWGFQSRDDSVQRIIPRQSLWMPWILFQTFEVVTGTGRAVCTFHAAPAHSIAPGLSLYHHCPQLPTGSSLSHST